MTNDEFYFYACEYMAKTELYDRSLTNCRSPLDKTEAFLDNPRVKKISNEYAAQLRKYYSEICGGTWRFIQNEIHKHTTYAAQMWIDEYYRLKEGMKLSMSIDRSLRILIDRYIDTYVICGGAKANSNYTPTINITREDYEAFKVAIGIMRKYQEIQEIVTEWQKQNDAKIKFVASNSNMTKIAEVLDGNDKKTKSSDEP